MQDSFKIKRLGGLYDTHIKKQAGAIWDISHICTTISTVSGGNGQPLIIEVIDERKQSNSNR